jgi:hypothetical protein
MEPKCYPCHHPVSRLVGLHPRVTLRHVVPCIAQSVAQTALNTAVIKVGSSLADAAKLVSRMSDDDLAEEAEDMESSTDGEGHMWTAVINT